MHWPRLGLLRLASKGTSLAGSLGLTEIFWSCKQKIVQLKSILLPHVVCMLILNVLTRSWLTSNIIATFVWVNLKKVANDSKNGMLIFCHACFSLKDLLQPFYSQLTGYFFHWKSNYSDTCPQDHIRWTELHPPPAPELRVQLLRR